MSRSPVRPRFRGRCRPSTRLPARASGTGTAASVPRPIPLRLNRDFRMLWTGQLLSDTGTQVGGLAYPLLILALTHSAALAGVAGTARAATLLCLQLPAGALADRFDRRLTMIVCDVMRAVLLAVLGVLVVAHLAAWPARRSVGCCSGSAGPSRSWPTPSPTRPRSAR